MGQRCVRQGRQIQRDNEESAIANRGVPGVPIAITKHPTEQNVPFGPILYLRWRRTGQRHMPGTRSTAHTSLPFD